MSERADLAVVLHSVPDDVTRHWCTKCDGTRPVTDDELRGMASELLSVLLPDVDWEALREALAWADPYGSVQVAPVAVARRLLAVYDGKDG